MHSGCRGQGGRRFQKTLEPSNVIAQRWAIAAPSAPAFDSPSAFVLYEGWKRISCIVNALRPRQVRDAENPSRGAALLHFLEPWSIGCAAPLRREAYRVLDCAMMFDLSSPNLAVTAAVFFLAGIVKGVTGMGLPTVAMGVLGAIMPPVTAASLLIVPSFVTNVWQLLAGPSFAALVSRLWLMMSGIVIGTVAGSRLLTSADTEWTTFGLGAALSLYAGSCLLARPLSVPARMERPLSPLIGLTTGLITGGTGVFVIPAVPYLQALGLDKDDLIQALGLSFTISTIALAAGLERGGAFRPGNIAVSVLAIFPALLGMWFGQWLRQRISAATFRRGFLICLMLLGFELAVRPFL